MESRAAILPEKLSKSAPHVNPSSSKPQTQEASSTSEIVICLTGECTVNNTVTPIRLHLRGYFTKLLQENKQRRSQPADKRKNFMVKLLQLTKSMKE